jgi:hypothetical protein
MLNQRQARLTIACAVLVAAFAIRPAAAGLLPHLSLVHAATSIANAAPAPVQRLLDPIMLPGLKQQGIEGTTTETLTGIHSQQVTLTQANGMPVTFSVDEATAQRLQGMVGKRLVVTRLKDGSVAVTPAFQQLTGTVASIKDGIVTLRTPEQTLAQIRLPEKGAQLMRLHAGSIVSALTTDGGVTMTVYSSTRATTGIHFIGRLVSRTGNSVSLLTADGVTHTLACTTCDVRRVDALVRNAHSTVFSVVSRGGELLQITPIVDGARIAGIIAGMQGSTLALLTGTGELFMLSCDCDVFPSVIADGVPVLVNLNAHGEIISARGYPLSKHVLGKIVRVASHVITLQMPNSKLMHLHCRCVNGRLGHTLLSPGMKISGVLDSRGNLVAALPVSGRQPTISKTSDPIRAASAQRTQVSATHKLCRCHHERLSRVGNVPEPASQRSYPRLLAFAPSHFLVNDCAVSSGTLILVRVRDSKTELPVYHARVTLLGRNGVTWLTSQGGTVEFDNAPPGTYRVNVSKAGFPSDTTVPFTLDCHRGLAATFGLAPLRRTSDPRVTPIARERKSVLTRNFTSRCRFVFDRESPKRRRFACTNK